MKATGIDSATLPNSGPTSGTMACADAIGETGGAAQALPAWRLALMGTISPWEKSFSIAATIARAKKEGQGSALAFPQTKTAGSQSSPPLS